MKHLFTVIIFGFCGSIQAQTDYIKPKDSSNWLLGRFNGTTGDTVEFRFFQSEERLIHLNSIDFIYLESTRTRRVFKSFFKAKLSIQVPDTNGVYASTKNYLLNKSKLEDDQIKVMKNAIPAISSNHLFHKGGAEIATGGVLQIGAMLMAVLSSRSKENNVRTAGGIGAGILGISGTGFIISGGIRISKAGINLIGSK